MIFSSKAKLAALEKRLQTLKDERKALRKRVKELEVLVDVPCGLDGVPLGELAYNSDGLSVWGKNLAFLNEDRFQRAYHLGAKSGHRFSEDDGDFHIEWRVHVALWAAGVGLRLDGDFVECGVNTGILSLAVVDYHRFREQNRAFFLFDTFNGVPEEQFEHDRSNARVSQNERFYPECYELAKANFSPYPNVKLIRGCVPDSLPGAGIEKVAYLSIDMNVATAEVAAVGFFWDKLAIGAPVVLDDYGWTGHEDQKKALDDFASSVGTSILTLPTGQGLMVKS